MNLNKRLFKSFVTGAIVLVFGVFFARSIFHDTSADGTSAILRRSFLWNEKVWEILKSNKRLSVKKTIPPAGKRPRVNGDLGITGPTNLKDYAVRIDQLEKSQLLPLGSFYAGPKASFSTDFRCIEGWSEELSYSGLQFSKFLELHGLGKKRDGTYYAYVGLETPDKEYYVSIDMESMLHPQTVLAYEMNGRPLRTENGAPLRLIIPIKYGIKSLKRIGRIYFSDQRPKDYWAERGYDWYSGL